MAQFEEDTQVKDKSLLSGALKITPSRILFIFCFTLVGSGIYGIINNYRFTHSPDPLSQIENIITYSDDTPDESSINNDDRYEVPVDQPRKIVLPSIGASGLIQKMGIDQNNAIATPSNTNLAGWYINSVKPGEIGVSLIDGHVQGKYRSGVFNKLHKLNFGDLIEIEFGDETIRRFSVVSVEILNVDEATKKMMAPYLNVTEQLNLITCGGIYNNLEQTYESRILVITKRI